MSKVVDGRFVILEAEKQQFQRFTQEYAEFCGIDLINFCLMDNHWHLVIDVPRAPQIPLSDEQLLVRIEKLSGSAGGKGARQKLTLFRERGQHDAAEALRRRYLVRMWDLSQFMKLVKQRFSQWFNRRHDRQGTLWQGRFKSTLVESVGEALACIAAYVDLNPIRAGIVDDPKDYRWSSYGQAVAGNESAQRGLREVVAGLHRIEPETLSLSEAMSQYRMWLFNRGEENEGVDEHGQPTRRGFSQEQVVREMLRCGRLPVADYLRMRVRYFEDGVVLGSKQFVNEVFQAYRSRFGPKRKDGARRMRGVASDELYVLRDLQKDVFGPRKDRGLGPG